MIVTTFVGYILFAIFAGVGFCSLPWDILVDFAYRPKQVDEGSFEERKKLLLQYAMELREDGQKLDENRNYVNKIKGITGMLQRY